MRYLVIILACLLLSAAPETASAQPDRAREGVRSGQMRSLDQILSDIRRSRPGTLSDVQGPNNGPGGEPRYRLKWLTPDGRVEWLDTDARTGRVLGVDGGERGSAQGRNLRQEQQNSGQSQNRNIPQRRQDEDSRRGNSGRPDFQPGRGRGNDRAGADRENRGNAGGRFRKGR